MNHLDVFQSLSTTSLADEFIKRASGRYYTHKSIADQMFNPLLQEKDFTEAPRLKVIDPFAGDGRLILWLIEFCSINNLNKTWDFLLIRILGWGGLFGFAKFRPL